MLTALLFLFACYYFIYSTCRAIHSCVLKSSTYLAIIASEFTHPHFTHKALVLSNAVLPNAPFSRNLILMLDEGSLVIVARTATI
jgi:hypothetical protein